jgi:hypothetical protein
VSTNSDTESALISSVIERSSEIKLLVDY